MGPVNVTKRYRMINRLLYNVHIERLFFISTTLNEIAMDSRAK